MSACNVGEPLQVDVISERVFKLRVGGLELSGFRIASEWEGFTKLEHPEKGMLIVARQGFAESFSDLLADIFGEQKDLSRRVTVLKGTPDLLHQLRSGKSS